jgi:pSer/pThr/pTyr-binding forkhead associated (FHA) protein
VTPAGLHSAYLQISGRQVPVRDGLVIGRGNSCDLVLDDPQAGDRHALIRLEGEQWLLQDLGTPGGTLVNGARLTTLPLSHGDQIQIGNSTLVFNFVHQGAEGLCTKIPGDALN